MLQHQHGDATNDGSSNQTAATVDFGGPREMFSHRVAATAFRDDRRDAFALVGPLCVGVETRQDVCVSEAAVGFTFSQRRLGLNPEFL